MFKFVYGFTMAEVLITLGVIGIVAAMTLPAVINNSRNKQLEAGLKRSYSVISQALDMYQAETGERITSQNIGYRKLKQILLEYLKTAQDCGWGYKGSGSAANITNNSCIKHYQDSSEDDTTYKNYIASNNINLALFDDGQFVLNDGSLILVENYGPNNPLYISVDVNGYNKNPNRLGHDLFMFEIDNKGKLIPMGVEGSKYYNKDSLYCSLTFANNLNGAGCTYKALTDKDYFKNLPK